MIKKILVTLGVLALIVVVLVAGLAVFIASRPNDFRITRSTTIAAPAAVVFTQVNDLHKWQAWSPWAKMDPSAKMTYSGPEAGTGASYTWTGNSQVGEGTMAVTESKPNDLVRFRLEFLKPFQGTNMAEFTFVPQGDQTQVTWTMSGQNNFVFKAVGLFMDCDKMVGSEFEKGLASLKAVSEAAAKTP